VASVLKSGLKPQDLLARIGGEEFLIIMPDVTKETACQRASFLCHHVANSRFLVPPDRKQLSVTISLGVTLMQNDDGSEHDAETLLDLADRALYASKADGRNMVSFCRAA